MIIAHRLETINDCDQIIELNGGIVKTKTDFMQTSDLPEAEFKPKNVITFAAL